MIGEHDPFVRYTAKQAQIAMATTPETEICLIRLACQKVQILSQLGMTMDEMSYLKNIPLHTTNPFRLVSIGKLLHWKGFHLGLKAFSQFKKKYPEAEYWLIGDGPERCTLVNLARNLGVINNVRFFGQIPRELVMDIFAESDVLVHPSLKESGGFVCLEAMAAGRPVVCLDLGGPALQVTEETGFKIPAIEPDQAVRDMAQAMLRLVRDPDLRKRMGDAGRKRVREHFLWDFKGDRMNEIYQEIVGNRIVN